jgi:hypothetical protein
VLLKSEKQAGELVLVMQTPLEQFWPDRSMLQDPILMFSVVVNPQVADP